MAYCRVETADGYTVMSNYHLRDMRLSLKARGLLSQILSLPEKWDMTISGLSKINRECSDTIASIIKNMPVIVPEEAEIIKKIFDMFLDGVSMKDIAKTLERQGCKTKLGKTEWTTGNIRNILTNEKSDASASEFCSSCIHRRSVQGSEATLGSYIAYCHCMTRSVNSTS